MELVFHVGVKDVIRFYLYLAIVTVPRHVLARIGYLASILLALLATSALRADNMMVFVRGLGFVFLILLLLGSMFLVLYVAMILSSRNENQPTGRIRMRVDSRGFSVDAERGLEVFPWHRVTDIGKSGDFIWLHADDRHYRFVPRKALANDDRFWAAWTKLRDLRSTG